MAEAAYRSVLRRTGSTPLLRSESARDERRRRLVRLLLPAVEDTPGFVSSELRVRVSSGRLERPDVGVATFAFPVDGVADRAPALAVLFDGGDPALWLRSGASAVWIPDEAHLTVYDAGGGFRTHPLGGVVMLPGPLPQWRVPTAAVCRG